MVIYIKKLKYEVFNKSFKKTFIDQMSNQHNGGINTSTKKLNVQRGINTSSKKLNVDSNNFVPSTHTSPVKNKKPQKSSYSNLLKKVNKLTNSANLHSFNLEELEKIFAIAFKSLKEHKFLPICENCKNRLPCDRQDLSLFHKKGKKTVSQTNVIHVPQTNVIPVPPTNVIPVPPRNVIPVPPTNVIPVPPTNVIPVPPTNVIPVLPKRNVIPVPQTNVIPVPQTNVIPVHPKGNVIPVLKCPKCQAGIFCNKTNNKLVHI